MIESIKNYYNAPSPCLDLCAPLQKYHAFFADQNEESTGFSKVALTIAWIATAFFAYPIFGLLAAVGVAIKAATCQQLEVDPVNMTDAQLQVWGQKPSTTTADWNEVQLKRMHQFLEQGVDLLARGKVSAFEASEHFGGLVDGNPWSNESVVGATTISLDDEGALTKLLAESTAGVLEQTNAGVRIEMRYMYQLGGGNDLSNSGVAHVACLTMACPADSDLLETDPVDMTLEQLQVWGQKPSTTPQQWNQGQLERMNRFFDVELNVVTLLFPVGVPPASPGGEWAGEPALCNTWCRLFGAYNPAEPTIETAKNLIANVVAGASVAGERIEIRWLATAGGCHDPEGHGAGFINCRKVVCAAAPDPSEVEPVNMTDEQLQVWGQKPSTTTPDWNEVQWQRFGQIFNAGVQLALEGNLTTSPAWQGPAPFLYPWDIGGPWEGEALHNNWCALSGYFVSALDTAEFKQKVAQAVIEATGQGTRMEIRFMYQVGDVENGGVIYINCRKI